MKTADEILRRCRRRGWRVVETKGGRIAIVSPRGLRVFCSKSLGTRAAANVEAALRRVERLEDAERE